MPQRAHHRLRDQRFHAIFGFLALLSAVTACRDHRWQAFGWSVAMLGYSLYRLEPQPAVDVRTPVTDDT